MSPTSEGSYSTFRDLDYAADMVHLAVAERRTPLAAQTSSKAPGRVGPLGAYPLFARGGRGALIHGIDNRTYIDFFNGNCAVTLGHGYAPVNQAVIDAVERGSLLSLPTPLEADIAERLAAVIPCAEQIRFVKTGSEACAGAVRIARIATGRDVIVVVRGQYHGWHDWHCITKAMHPGVPEYMAAGIRMFDYNDIESLRAVMGPDVAAVMLEPTLAVAPAPWFLENVKAIAHTHGALLIFDEMITGARWHIGGAQAVFGVTPDLATCGKAYANGVPLAFIAGSADVMKHAWCVSGTFGGETLGLAACRAVLDAHQTPMFDNCDPVELMHRVGRVMTAHINGVSADAGFPGRLSGPMVRPVWDWSGLGATERPVVVSLLQQELAARGVLVHPSGWNTSAAHEPWVLEKALHAIEAAIRAVVVYMQDDPVDWIRHLRGELIHDGSAVRS